MKSSRFNPSCLIQTWISIITFSKEYDIINYFSIIILLFLITIVFSENSEENLIDCGDGILCNKDCLVYDESKGTLICNCYLGQNEVNCKYKQKSQLKAFLLEFFLCYTAGHFYINNYKLVAPKLVVFVVFYCLKNYY